VSHHFVRVGQNLHSLLLGGIQPPYPPIRRDTGRLLSNPLLGIFASLIPHKGNSAFDPPNIGGVYKGRGGFAALLTLEGCPKDGVVSAPSASLTLTVLQASLVLVLFTYLYEYQKARKRDTGFHD